ncbi:Regulatory protein NPR5 [Senna tora]|uniref:Regulatory protein NPR5 n=1 Tax=Senna tora TaxID=362788 RepID=A0A835CH47_9FABA|nr:Regulatory protein NPR5 [Senna tora]
MQPRSSQSLARVGSRKRQLLNKAHQQDAASHHGGDGGGTARPPCRPKCENVSLPLPFTQRRRLYSIAPPLHLCRAASAATSHHHSIFSSGQLQSSESSSVSHPSLASGSRFDGKERVGGKFSNPFFLYSTFCILFWD